MSEYVAPLREMRFVMQELAGLEQVVSLPGCEEASPDVVDAILEEAAKFAGEVLSPLNPVDSMEFLLEKIKATDSNAEFLDSMNS